MANTIELVTKYQAIVDLIYKADSMTAGMDAAIQPDFTNTPEVKYLQVSTKGFGDYNRENGYPRGSAKAVWKNFLLEIERGVELGVDRMDNEETLNLTFGTLIGNFTREHMIPELDAYRFAKYATKGAGSVAGVLDRDNIVDAIDEGTRSMNAGEVTAEGRRLFINSDLQPALNQALDRRWGSDTTINTIANQYNGMPITYVPPARFYTSINLKPGTGTDDWGFVPNGSPINFMIIQPNAIVQAVKLAVPKLFNPDVNQDMDEWKYQFRLYHDCFVYDNKLTGVYTHNKGSI